MMRGERIGDADVQAWLEARAQTLIATLLEHENAVLQLQAMSPRHDDDFATRLVDYELGLIADGEHPLAIALRVKVIGAAREALFQHDEIRSPPGALPHHIATGLNKEKLRRGETA